MHMKTSDTVRQWVARSLIGRVSLVSILKKRTTRIVLLSEVFKKVLRA